MPTSRLTRRATVLLVLLASACATPTPPLPPGRALALANRISWGADSAELHALSQAGPERYLERELHPSSPDALPAAVQSQIDAMEISRLPYPRLALELEHERQAADAVAGDDDRKTAQQAYQQHMNRLARESATRSLLRDLYAPQQLREQMTWFWVNHFSVHQYKSGVRALLADYEDGLRARALGRFRDLLGFSAHHPAMLLYLDNNQNARGHLNENYARELMELHTLGVDAGYSQRDVQELARILTGFGVSYGEPPRLRPDWQAQYRRQGLLEFNPARHDYGDKRFLGRPLRGRGAAELDEVLDRLARHPATARFVSRKLAQYFVGDTPSPALLDTMSRRFLDSDGRIADVLRVLFDSPEFSASLGHRFKDPIHYLVSAVRLAYDDKVILNAGPILGWLNRMGEPLYGHSTPEGYPLLAAGWAGSGQLNTRFEIARAIGSGNAGLFRNDAAARDVRAAFPQLANAVYYAYWQATLAAATRSALDQAQSPQEWNTFLLASPDFMYR
jgi:uncharacterized protein (DUF1800 family)